MIRRLNYTGRRNIPRSRVTIRLVSAVDGDQSFSADFDLKGFRFPSDASVYVEAYNTGSYMRFPFGTVGQPDVPQDTRLTEVTPRPLPKFRLKVVDQKNRHGLLIGVADKVIPLRPDEDLRNRQSLLPVDFCDLGERVWQLDLSDWPVLELNSRVENISEAARSSGGFMGLLYPEVLRRILHFIVVEQGETDPDADETEWTTLWLRYACSLSGIGPPPAMAGHEVAGLQAEWVEDVVQAFCRARHARTRLQAAVAKELG